MIDFSKDFDFPENIPLSFFFNILCKTQRTYANYLLKQYDLSFSQLMVILKLLDKENISQTEICEILNEDRGSLARILNILEDKEYIIREQDKNNRRKNIIYLTKEGKELALSFRHKLDEREKKITEELQIDVLELKENLKIASKKAIEFNHENIGG